ncbi:GGDEF domain-containing response regulator [Desulfoferrobacter suflitae]|uniref:GGDEF domain-containing response regulator n=1 Tax=Desulfoferrobacter suflitae TaxID=2865782 RepID=UPI0021646A44|nr:diguanylate cyclase [Desulfoferrobacter suflitae]MCK8602175.1 diguanylate cyclase [Desulfoferrobacter suflitae]
MKQQSVKVLLVEDNPEDALLVEEMLVESPFVQFEIARVERLAEAFDVLQRRSFDVLLLDLNLPDSHGRDTARSVHIRVPNVPIVVLGEMNDEELGAKAVKDGAQDFLIKGEINSPKLVRSIRYAIERQALRTELITLSLIDELTGLHNRRSFMALATQHLHLARRMAAEFLILFADVDNMKEINDNFGHLAGDEALRRIADILRNTFRKSDIIARVGGDEFIILASGASYLHVADILKRLLIKFEEENARGELPCRLSVSLGIARYDPNQNQTLEDLIEQADRSLYQNKRSRKLSPWESEDNTIHLK